MLVKGCSRRGGRGWRRRGCFGWTLGCASNKSKRPLSPFLALAAAGRPGARLVSSKGRHLKCFLYPPHGTLRLSHWWQDGLVSSHFNRFALQVMQPE